MLSFIEQARFFSPFVDQLHFASCSDGQVVTMDRVTGNHHVIPSSLDIRYFLALEGILFHCKIVVCLLQTLRQQFFNFFPSVIKKPTILCSSTKQIFIAKDEISQSQQFSPFQARFYGKQVLIRQLQASMNGYQKAFRRSL